MRRSSNVEWSRLPAAALRRGLRHHIACPAHDPDWYLQRMKEPFAPQYHESVELKSGCALTQRLDSQWPAGMLQLSPAQLQPLPATAQRVALFARAVRQ